MFQPSALRRSFVVSVLLLVATACSSGTTPPPQAAGKDTFVAPDVGTPPAEPVTVNLGTAGGKVEHKSGAKLKVPAGALPADVELTMEAKAPPASVAEVGTPLGAALLLGPEGQTFLVPVQIAVPLDPSLLAGINPSEMQIVLAPATGGEFTALDTTYDAAGKQLLAETSHFSIAVPVKSKGPPLKFAQTSPLPPGKTGTAYGPLKLQISGGKPPYTFSLAGGNLPMGLALAPDGALSGTPEQAGSFAFSVKVKDKGGQALEKALACDVDGPPNPMPVVDSVDPASAKAGGGDLAITVNGKDFVVGAQLTVNGKGIPTTRDGATALKGKLTAAHLAQPGTLQLAAVNPPKGGGASNTIAFAVTAADADISVGDISVGDTSVGDDADAGSIDTDASTEDAGSGDSIDGGGDASPTCVPSTELCDGKDNDCNGKTDDNPCCALGAGTGCDDNNVCTSGEKCTDSVCGGGDVTVCTDDGNLCTDDACDPKAGCAFPANNVPCNDGKACTQGDKCVDKACASGKDPLCNDGNACTLDTCSETGGCKYLPTEGACDDGDGCTVGEVCALGLCGGATKTDCNDGNGCTLDTCDTKTGKCAVTTVAGCGAACQTATDCKDDGNPCTLAECATGVCAVAFAADKCDDGDPCSSADTCKQGQCAGSVAACNDGNACTVDACGKDGKCTSAPATGGCEDGNLCTILEVCKDGTCAPGGTANCDDSNNCTDDSCDPKVGCQHPDSATPCTDDDPCSIGDACKGGSCKPTGPKDCSDPDDCTLDSCDAKTGTCVNKVVFGCGDNCAAPSDCKDDSNPCTEWLCETGKCKIDYLTSGCNDGDACSEKDTCGQGKCVGSGVVCTDTNPCTDAGCDKASGCVFLANTATCTDGQVCTVGDNCKDKACVSGAAADCDDQNDCTFDICDSKQGCTHEAAGLGCSDGNPCTTGDSCDGEKCKGGTAKVCDDGNGCTSDACDGATGKCAFTGIAGCGASCSDTVACPESGNPCIVLACGFGVCAASDTTATCDDGSVCTAKDACSKGTCVGNSSACDDANGCTADSCDAKTGCAHKPELGPCEDGDLCTVQDKCVQGAACKAGLGQQCDDANPCTADGCDPKVGCQFAPISVPCDDKDPCTVVDVCSKGACLPGDPSPCDDGNGCTTDSCNSAGANCDHAAIKGCGDACQADGDCPDDGNACTAQVCGGGKCAVQPAAGACDDGNPCTTLDSCFAAKCGGSPTPCSDGNPCTTDSCDPKSGCAYAANTAPCSLGNACSNQDVCKDKLCAPGPAVNCDDGNACTLDTCDPDAGCDHAATAAPCDDSNPCTKEDECGDGTCMGGVLVACDDGSACTADSCDAATGKCEFAALKGCGTKCTASKDCEDDGNPCTQAVCAGGGCVIVYTEMACNDGDVCSAGDTCLEGKCTGTESACDDGNACTADACDAKTGCSSSAKDGPCDDGSVCTVGDACKATECKGAKLLNCDDGDVCTSDGCDVVIGCTSSANTAPCNDNNACTTGDACAKGQCQAGKVVACDDNKPCTLDACDLGTGKCKSKPIVGCGGNCATDSDCPASGNACAPAVCAEGVCGLAISTTACDDGNACTSGDKCGSALCVGGPTECDDDSPCTADGCDPKTGCTHAAVAGGCDDNNACTAGDACDSGKCAGGKAVNCADANPCTTESCNPNLGCLTLPNDVTCDDGNVCTVKDKCLNTFCGGGADKDCDDNNPCTKDACSTAKGCVSTPTTDTCEDGNACTEKDACADGKCAAGAAKVCDDGNACTKDSCNVKLGCAATATTGDCDDGNQCTSGDFCQNGNCSKGQAKDCNDNNPCTADSCSQTAGCLAADTTETCSDDDACTVGDQCDKGQCVSGLAPNCNDANPCTDDSCDKAAGCKTEQNTKPCSDGDACTTQDVCLAGKCQGGAPPVCDDNNPCTGDKCDANKGCIIAPLDVTCTDNDACTTTDNCKDGDCIPGPKPNCDDGKVCTDDSCDTVKGCVNLANTATCTDDTVCTEGDGCKDGACVPGKAKDCNDNNACTDDSCDPAKGCASVHTTKACNDGDACTTQDTCASGNCTSKPTVCDDNNGCTSDTCDSLVGCLFTNTVTACSDGDACTAPDLCSDGSCKVGAMVECDDKNLCTDDSCDKAKGCVNAPNTKACSDGTVCTSSDACAGGKCDGAAVNCDDTNLCTDDSCDKVSGCVNLANTITCSDSDACTLSDACKDGACLAGAPPNCDDNNACTDDSCDKVKGCQHANNTAACSDGDACTSADKCATGNCGGTVVNCDDGNACTDDACDKLAGCKNTANTATNCSDGNACTSNDACAQGKCNGTPVTCNDNVACTVDSCVPATGCKFAPNNNLCNDNESCTTESCDAVAGCKKTTANDNSGCTSSDPCVTQPVCLSGKCAQKPKVTVKNMALHPTALLSNGDTTWVVTSNDPQTYYHILRLDADLNTEFDVKFQGAGGPSERLTGDLWGGGFFDTALIVASNTHDGNPVHNRIRRIHEGNGSEVWNKPTPQPMTRIRIDNGGVAGVPQTSVTQNNDIHFFDTSGNLQYSHKLPAFGYDLAYDGNWNQTYFVCGHTLQSPGSFTWKPWVAKIRRNGYLEIQWQKSIGSTFGDGLSAYACTTYGGNLFVYSNDGSWPDQSVVRKIDGNGNVVWTKSKLAADANHQTSGAFMIPGWGGAVLAGMQDGNYAMASNVSDSGNLSWSKTYFNYEYGGNIKAASLGSSLMLGGWYQNVGKGTPAYAFVLKVNQDGSVGAPTCTAQNLCAGKTCNDSVACTMDSCDPKTGCVYTPDNTQCDDGNLCTANACDAVKGCTYTASTAACDDKNPCTDEACDAIKGCTNTANTQPCEDGNACTTGDTCGGKACLGGPAKNCEDGIACTSHGCDTKTGCKQTANHAKCDDKKPCTADTCDLALGCTYAADIKLCDDANTCTDDTCDNIKGCAHTANVALCTDDNVCTVADACSGGACKPGPSKVCDDNKECTTDSCDSVSGCKVVNKPSNASCTPSNSCYTSATCGGDGNCYDGLSKYWVYQANDGHMATHTMMAQPNDGGGPVFVYNDANTAYFARRNILGQTQYETGANSRQWWGVRCSPWDNSYCVAFGKDLSGSSAIANTYNFSNGSYKDLYAPTMTSGQSIFTDASFISGGPTTYSGFGCPGGGSTCDAFVYTTNQNQKLLAFTGGNEDRATSLHIDGKNGSWAVGYTLSKGAGGYDAWYASIGNPEFSSNSVVTDVTTYGGSGDEQFHAVLPFNGAVWAFGTAPVNGQTTPIAVRIAGGPQVVKSYPSMWGFGELGAATYGPNVFLAGVRGDIAKLDGNLDIVWQNSYPKQPINVAYRSIAVNGTAILIAGGGYNGQTGKSSTVLGRLSMDGLTNCTDKNPCATLAANGCDDKIACTADACDVQKGCLHSGSDAQCEDGNPCTKNQCDGVKGCIYPQDTGVPCNDKKPCTVDSCDIGAAKCVFKLDPGKACDDGNACSDDLCDGNGNCAHNNTNCNDDKVCTIDSCDSGKGGCQHALIYDNPCDDGNYCTVYEACGKAGVLTEGKCTPAGEICQQAIAPVFHAHAGVAKSLLINNGKIDAWYQIEAAVGQNGKGFAVPFNSKPVMVKAAVFGRDAVDTASTGLQMGTTLSGAFTLVLAVRTVNEQVTSDLFSLGKWRGKFYDGKLNLMFGGAGIASVPWQSGKDYLLFVRADAKEARLQAFAGGSPSVASVVSPGSASLSGTVGLSLNKSNSNNPDSNAVFAQVLLYDKALTDGELQSMATKLQTQWGLAACKQNSDCGDANPCTNDFCTQNPGAPWECTHEGVTMLAPGVCKDNNPCTVEEVCDKGQCVGSKPSPCDDGKPCTKDFCDPIKGCGAVEDNSLTCNDGNACTYEFCSGGGCSVGTITCDDKNACTADSCDKASGCVFAATTALCDDGNPCTSNDACANKACAGINNTLPCNDYHPCTIEEKCKDGACLDSKPVVCPDDGNACTVEECTYWSGCKIGSIKACNDGNPCTDDACNVASGQCAYKPNAVSCSDGNPCSQADYCQSGKCWPGKFNECEDGDICTLDKCTVEAGCKHTYTNDCHDGDWCSENDLCIFGSCLPGGQKNCDDGNACTIDSCNAPGGSCVHVAVADKTPCSDGVLCTLPDQCMAGTCKPGPKVCDYAVTTLGDGSFWSTKDGLEYAEHGSLREAIFDANYWVKFDTKPTVRTIRFFVEGKLTLSKNMDVVLASLHIEAGGKNVIIDADGKYRAMTFAGGQSQVKDIKLQNGFVDKASDPEGAGTGALVVVNAAKLTLNNCTLYGGTSEYGGGGVLVKGGAEVLLHAGSVVQCIRKKGLGGPGPNGTLLYGDGGGAVRVEGANSKLIVNGVRFDYNSGPGPGGSIWCGPGSACDIRRSSFYGGVAHSGAVGVAKGGSAILTNVTINANQNYGIGTGVYSEGVLTLLHTTISGNSAIDETEHPALYVDGPTTIINSIISEAGSTKKGLDCRRGPNTPVFNVIKSIITVTSSKSNWGPAGSGLACSGGLKPPFGGTAYTANLQGQKLIGNARVMLPTSGSSAIDTGSLEHCLAQPVGGLDILGGARPQGNGCDLGSVELP